MKITDAIIIFIIVFTPFFFFTQAKSENTTQFVEENQKHESAVTSAAHDAINALSTNVIPKLERGYDSYKFSPADPNIAFETFMQSLALNYQVETDNKLELLSIYVPVFSVLDYDGLLLNVFQKTESAGNIQFERVWLPKIPFSYTDDIGNVINFTLGSDIEIYDRLLNEWHSGTREELALDDEISIALLQDEDTFHQIKQQLIVDTMQEHFSYYVNEHNVYAKYLDMTYKFVMPLIPEEDWYNTIKNVSVFAFFQGYQYKMANQAYNEFAFVGAHFEKNERVMAGIVDNQRLYWDESCNYDYVADEIYPTRKAAAAAGYKESSCLNPF